MSRPVSRLAALFAVAALLGFCAPTQAAYQTFFGLDLNGSEVVRLATHPNADAARNSFLSNLVGVGTETFESYANGQSINGLVITFPGAGTATMQGGGAVTNVPPPDTNGFGRYPISGNQYVDTTEDFRINFSGAVAAFGFYATDIGDFSGDLQIQLTNGVVETFSLQALSGGLIGSGNSSLFGSVLYFGVLTTVPGEAFTSVQFINTNPGNDIFGFDDMTIGSIEQVVPQAVPAPPAVILALLGVAGLGSYRLRRRYQSAA